MLYSSSSLPPDVLESRFLVTLDRMGSPQLPNIFLAHSDDRLLSRLSVQLCRCGCRVERFLDAESLLERMADDIISARAPNHSQAIIADAKLRGRNGCRLLTDLRHAGWTIPFVLISRSAGRHLDGMVRRLGLACVFSIPFEVEDLITALYFLIEQASDVRMRRNTGRLTGNGLFPKPAPGQRPRRMRA